LKQANNGNKIAQHAQQSFRSRLRSIDMDEHLTYQCGIDIPAKPCLFKLCMLLKKLIWKV